MGPVEDEETPTPWQQWVWSESGTQLINLGTGIPMGVDGYSTFIIEEVETWHKPYTMIKSAYNPSQAFDCWFAPVSEWNNIYNPPHRIALGNAHGGGNQRWNVTIITDCVPVAVPYGDTFQLWNLGRRKRVLAETGEGSVTMFDASNEQWQWASNSCFSEPLLCRRHQRLIGT